MNKNVQKMLEEALKYNNVEDIFDGKSEEKLDQEYFKKLSNILLPATKLEILIKSLKKQISLYKNTNIASAQKFEEMLQNTINHYNERRQKLSSQEATETQMRASNEIINDATRQAFKILKEMNESKESFKKFGLTFEEKIFLWHIIFIVLSTQLWIWIQY